MKYEVRGKNVEKYMNSLVGSEFASIGIEKSGESYIFFVDNETDFEEMLSILSFMIALDYMSDVISKDMANEAEERIDEIKTEVFNDLTKDAYLSALTCILLREYFKNKTMINIDTFKKFNMKGFEKDATIISSYTRSLMSEGDYNESQFESVTGDEKYISVFESVRESLMVNGFDFSSYETLTVSEDDGYKLLTSAGEIVTSEFFGNILNMKIEVEAEEYNLAFVNFIATINISILVFKPQNIVIDKSILPMEKKMILENVLAHSKLIQQDINIL